MFKLSETEANYASLQGKVTEMTARIKHYEVELEKLEEAEETIALNRKAINEYHEQNATLEARLGTANAESEGLKRRLERLSNADDTIAKLRGRIAEHSQTIKDYENDLKLTPLS